jgi:hypothetical protein
MSDDPNDVNDVNDLTHPSQAEGEDLRVEPRIVLEQVGTPSQSEGEDPDRPDEHVVLDPAEPD